MRGKTIPVGGRRAVGLVVVALAATAVIVAAAAPRASAEEGRVLSGIVIEQPACRLVG